MLMCSKSLSLELSSFWNTQNSQKTSLDLLVSNQIRKQIRNSVFKYIFDAYNWNIHSSFSKEISDFSKFHHVLQSFFWKLPTLGAHCSLFILLSQYLLYLIEHNYLHFLIQQALIGYPLLVLNNIVVKDTKMFKQK